jgi:hypothetical protein
MDRLLFAKPIKYLTSGKYLKYFEWARDCYFLNGRRSQRLYA